MNMSENNTAVEQMSGTSKAADSIGQKICKAYSLYNALGYRRDVVMGWHLSSSQRL